MEWICFPESHFVELDKNKTLPKKFGTKLLNGNLSET